MNASETMKTIDGRDAIPMARWGKDHWSTFGYIETRIVDHGGAPDRDHMRTDVDRHPHLVGRRIERDGLSPTKHPTMLRDNELANDHDDWDCADDAVVYGLLEDIGTGLNRAWKLTPYGVTVASALRAHKAGGGQFATFVAPTRAAEALR